jgi:hypothetical protein
MVLPGPQADPTCPLCSKGITSGSLVLFEHGDLFHIRCMTERLGYSTLREMDRAREARTRAVENLDRSARLLEELRRTRKSPAPDTPDDPPPGP